MIVIFSRAFILFLGVVFFLSFIDFGEYSSPDDKVLKMATNGIVLGGDRTNRILLGIRLLTNHKLSRLFVSGQDLSIYSPSFVEFFSKYESVDNIKHISKCCIEWSNVSENTFQNARETKCWVLKNDLSGPYVLITSPEHMARALLIFSNEFKDTTFIPYSAIYLEGRPSRTEMLKRFLVEYIKTVVTHFYLTISFNSYDNIIYGKLLNSCDKEVPLFNKKL